MIIDLRIPTTMPGRSSSGFHRPGLDLACTKREAPGEGGSWWCTPLSHGRFWAMISYHIISYHTCTSDSAYTSRRQNYLAGVFACRSAPAAYTTPLRIPIAKNCNSMEAEGRTGTGGGGSLGRVTPSHLTKKCPPKNNKTRPAQPRSHIYMVIRQLRLIELIG